MRKNVVASLPGPFRSLIAALVVVIIAMIGLFYFEDPVAQRHWPVIAAPVMPAVFVLTLFFIGGAHGISWSREQQAAAVFGIALIMWWIVMEGCRRLWMFIRRRADAA